MADMTLKELCAASGVTRRAVQGYEAIGLVKATSKSKYGHLIYDENAQERIKTIKLYQSFGFKLKEIRDIIDAPDEVLLKKLHEQVFLLKQEREKAIETVKIIETMISDLEKNLKNEGR